MTKGFTGKKAKLFRSRVKKLRAVRNRQEARIERAYRKKFNRMIKSIRKTK